MIRKLKGVSVLSEQLRSQTEKKVRTAAEALMREAEKGAAGLNRWMEDRTALISADSLERIRSSDNPLITLEHRQVPKQITTGLFCFAAASGVLSNSTEITRFTRAWMDHDRSVIQQMFRKVFDPAEAREISAWMDRVPGHAHRLHHGHDLAALMELRTQYGLDGILSWANHVMARDFWTPHGVPYLPAGSGSVYKWLVDTGVSPANAMSLLSINAAEAASGLLFVTAGRRLWRGASKFIANQRYSRALMNIKKLAGDNRHDEALKQLDRLQILADRNASPHLKLDLALFCLGMSLEPDFPSAKAWGHRAFRISEPLVNAAVDTPESTDYQGGTEVSFAGLAGTIAMTAFAPYAQSAPADLGMARVKAELAVYQYLQTAQRQRSGWAINGRKVLGYRPYSAMTNQLLALELAVSVGALTRLPDEFNPVTIRNELLDTLTETMEREGEGASFLKCVSCAVERVYPLGQAAGMPPVLRNLASTASPSW